MEQAGDDGSRAKRGVAPTDPGGAAKATGPGPGPGAGGRALPRGDFLAGGVEGGKVRDTP